ncbi:MAG: WD40/YVTN/BNR-like repeat-containing protein [Sphingomonadales bacterium]
MYFSRVFILIGILFLSASATAQIDAKLMEGMTARSIGLASTSGRIAAIDVVNSNTNIMYVATASGGVWKSENAGLSWTPIFEDQPFASIGAIAINQQNPDIIWVGTGEGNVRNSVAVGGGIFKSLDGGNTWALMGLPNSEHINRIALDPNDPDIAYVAALGTLWGRNKERGVYKTINGGVTWQNILYIDDTTGATDIKMDPSNPHKLFAAMWEFNRKPYHFKSGGKGSGLYVSHNGGAIWSKYTEEDGMPKGELGRMTVTISPSDPNVVYTLVEAEKSALIRSENGGKSWHTVNSDTNIAGRPFYYMEVLVDPNDPETVYNIESNVFKSNDGGKKFNRIKKINCCASSNTIHIDTHAMWINPRNSDHLIVGNDGGIGISMDGSKTWRFVANLPVAQFYHVNVDNDQPYHVYGGLQDNGSWRGPAELWENGGIRNLHWEELGFGDGFDAAPHPNDSMVGYGQSQGGNLYWYNLRNGGNRPIAPYTENLEVELRYNWNPGFAVNPFNVDGIYFGSQFVHKSNDRGETWQRISDDLTTNNPDHQLYKKSGGLTSDVTAAENYTTIVSIVPSPLDEKVIWVGTDDGRVHVTRNGGNTWTSIEDKAKARGLKKGAWVPMIEASPHNASTAFIVMDDHRRSDMGTYAFKVENYGRKWTSISRSNLRGYALSIQQDHIDPDLLFLGTELGLYVSIDGGSAWTKWSAGVPTVSVMDMAIQERESDLVLGTHGRSIIIIDDYSGLRNLDKDDFKSRLKLLSVSKGIEYSVKQSPSSRFTGDGAFRGENQPYGSMITFIMSGRDLKHPDPKMEKARMIAKRAEHNFDDKDLASKKPEGDGKITIKISQGGTIFRTFKQEVHQGINRIVWNLKKDGKPLARKPGQEALEQLPEGREVLPGVYKVTLTYGDDEDSGSLEVIQDPRTNYSKPDLKANSIALDHLSNINYTANMAVERIDFALHDIDLIKAMIKNAEDGSRKPEGDGETPLLKASKQADDIKKILKDIRKFFRNPEDTKGITDGSFIVTYKISQGLRLVGGTKGKPSATAIAAIKGAEHFVGLKLDEVNKIFEGELKAFKATVTGLKLEYLEANAPLSIPPR